MDFQFNPVVPKVTHNESTGGNGGSSVDWEAINEYTCEQLGGEGKHTLIGVVTQLAELGLQELDEQTVLVDHKDYANHEWRLEEVEVDGTKVQKDTTARIETRKRKGNDVEMLVYQPDPVAQMAITVDFPEKMINLGQFFGKDDQEDRPFREIIGANGYVPKPKWGKNVIAKPFNLRHTNVNRQIEGAEPHYAFSPLSMIWKLANWCGVTDDNDHFHIEDLGKLIGKPAMFEVEVLWNKWNDKNSGKERKKLEVNIKPISALGPRDIPFYESDIKPNFDTSLLGVIQFSGASSEKMLKEINSRIVNTMKFSPMFESSQLKQDLMKHNPKALGIKQSEQTSENKEEKKQEPKQEVKSETVKEPITDIPEQDIDFDDK